MLIVINIRIDDMIVYCEDAAMAHIYDFFRGSTIYYDVILSQDNVSMKRDNVEQV